MSEAAMKIRLRCLNTPVVVKSCHELLQCAIPCLYVQVCLCMCVRVCIRWCQCVCLRSVHLLYSSLLHASAYQHALAYTCACCMGRVSEWLDTPKVFVWILSISVRHYMGACIGGTWVSSQRMLQRSLLASLGMMGAHAITHTLFYTCTLSCR